MNHRKMFVLIFACMLWASILNIRSQTYIAIKNVDGTERNFGANTLKNISFSESDLRCCFLNGSNELFSLSSVQKLVFSIVTAEKKLPSSNKISLYPNPANEYIILKNKQESEEKISIYSISGVLVGTHKLSSESQQIFINQLPKGIYLLKVNNQTYKFIKQ